MPRKNNKLKILSWWILLYLPNFFRKVLLQIFHSIFAIIHLPTHWNLYPWGHTDVSAGLCSRYRLAPRNSTDVWNRTSASSPFANPLWCANSIPLSAVIVCILSMYGISTSIAELVRGTAPSLHAFVSARVVCTCRLSSWLFLCDSYLWPFLSQIPRNAVSHLWCPVWSRCLPSSGSFRWNCPACHVSAFSSAIPEVIHHLIILSAFSRQIQL